MSPSKPVRRLPESERRAQLSSLLEEDELDLSHQVADSMFTNGELTPSISVFNETSETTSENIAPQLTTPADTSPRPHSTIDLLSDDWLGHAPLATPETLSAASSFSSLSSLHRQQCLQRGGDHTRLKADFVKLETIKQSPRRQSLVDEPVVEVQSAGVATVHEPLAYSTPTRVDHAGHRGFDAIAWPTPIRIPVMCGDTAPVHCGTAVSSCTRDDELLFNGAEQRDTDAVSQGMRNVDTNMSPLSNGLPALPAEGDLTEFDTERVNMAQSLRGCNCEKQNGTPEKGRLRRTYSDGHRVPSSKRARALHNGDVKTCATRPQQCKVNGSDAVRCSDGDVIWGCEETKGSWVCDEGNSRAQDDIRLST